MTGCRVTLPGRAYMTREHLCAQPVVEDGLCSKHLADRERMLAADARRGR